MKSRNRLRNRNATLAMIFIILFISMYFSLPLCRYGNRIPYGR